jgi:hypothetical protein
MAWLTGSRRLHRRYERQASHFLARPPWSTREVAAEPPAYSEAVMTTAAILDQFDYCVSEAVFPDLANAYYYPVDVRMSLFHRPGEWGMVVEPLGYSPRARNLTDVLHVFDNCLTRGEPEFCNDDFFDRIENIDELTDDGRSYRGSRFARVRGRELPSPVNREHLSSTSCGRLY